MKDIQLFLAVNNVHVIQLTCAFLGRGLTSSSSSSDPSSESSSSSSESSSSNSSSSDSSSESSWGGHTNPSHPHVLGTIALEIQ